MRTHPSWSAVLLSLAACGTATPSPGPSGPVQPPIFTARPSLAEASRRFTEAGCQPGQPLPRLSLVGLDGEPVDLAARTAGRALVLVTCSLTCDVARRQQAAVTALQRELGERAMFVMVYTVDAHPDGDACPYTGVPWVPAANTRDAVLVRQPTTLAARLELARRYANDWAGGMAVFVDTMDDASWHALGQAPNLGLCVDRDGVITARTGWFDADNLRAAVDRLPAR